MTTFDKQFRQDQTGRSRSTFRTSQSITHQFILPSLISVSMTALPLGVLWAVFTLFALPYLPMLFAIFLATFSLFSRVYYYIWKPSFLFAQVGVWATILLAVLGSAGVHLAICYIAWYCRDSPLNKVSPKGFLAVTILNIFSFIVFTFLFWVIAQLEPKRRLKPPDQ